MPWGPRGFAARAMLFGMDDLFGGYDGYGVDRSSFSDKSAAAQRREDQAKAAFLRLKQDTEAAPPGKKTTYELLGPEVHLTQVCYKAFRKYVAANAPAWTVVRVQATPEQKAAAKQTRKTAVYFTKVTYHPEKDQRRARDENEAPAAKKAKTATSGM